jgi:hypothetical protein
MPLLNDSDKVFLGGTALDAVYLGGAEVWPSGGTQPPAAPMGYRFAADMEGWVDIYNLGWGWDPAGGAGALHIAATGPVDGSRNVGLFKGPVLGSGDPGPDTIAELQRIGLVVGKTYRATWTWWITGGLPTGVLERHMSIEFNVASTAFVPGWSVRIEKTGTMPVGVQTTVSEPFVFDPARDANTTKWRPVAMFSSNSTGDNDMYIDSLVYEEVSP